MKKVLKKWFNKLMGKPPEPAEVRKICAVVGEKPIGTLILDIQTYNQDGEVLGYPTERVEVKIRSRIRRTVNRILSYEGTGDDFEVLELYVFKHLKL